MRNARTIIAATAAAATLMSLAACGSGTDGSTAASTDSDEKVQLNFWGWGNGLKETVEAFEKANPNITVKYNNTGTAADTATALQNAVAAGKGAPDVVMMEDPTVTQFAVDGSLIDLAQFGAADLKDDYAAGPWNKVQYDGKPYALPIDSGPEVFFYNDAVFKQAGVDGSQIKTWDDFYEAAKKIHALGGDHYITNNSGDSNAYQPFTAQAWQAGAQPWKVNGDKLTIDMVNDKGMKRYIDFQQKLIDEDLVNTSIANWSDDWNRSLNDGTTAALVIGGWMPTNLESGAPDQAGNWRVAPLPQWEEGEQVSAEDGGSALAIPAQSKNQEAAYKFVEFLTHGDGADVMADHGTFPSLKRILNDEDFQNEENDFFGGQQVNKVLCEAANLPVTEFQYLPYNPYAQSQFGDKIAPAYQGKKTLKEAFEDYQKALASYGEQQGYTVTVK